MKRNASLAAIVLIAAGISACQDAADRQVAEFRDLNGNGKMEPYEDSSLPRAERVDDILSRMSMDQKIRMVSGVGYRREGLPPELDKVPGAAGYTIALENLGMPSIVLADGPAGVRIRPDRDGDEATYYATAFPVATVVSSSWDKRIARSVGEAMGNETREYGVDILLAPGLNIHRDPRGGRNFEYYSEDPYLSGHIAAAMVAGVQSAAVGATPKHYVANNQETNRYVIDTIVSERALREIYLRGFRIVVEEADPWSIMSAYNQVNGTPASQEQALMRTVLRDEWGFKGVVMTDWFAGMDDTVAQMRSGNELLMPGTDGGTEQIRAALENGDLDESVLDRNVAFILDVILRTPSFSGYEFSNKPDLDAHANVARAAASEGTVLLKNDGQALPMSGDARIAAFGNTSYDFISGGAGSGDVNEAYTVSLVEALETRNYEIDEELRRLYTDHIDAEKAKLPESENFWELPPPIPEVVLDPGMIAAKAASADIALITIGRNSGELQDRPLEGDFYLTAAEKTLISDVSTAFHAQDKKAIVILNIGNVIETASWRNAPDAIVVPWQGGQEAGNALVDVLTGDVNPSGKLPTTFPITYDDVPSSDNFPGIVTSEELVVMGLLEAYPSQVDYEEGVYVGYRYYDTFGVDPAYEFGYGLSYTDFEYADVSLSSDTFDARITASVTVTNVGDAAGKEVIQLYLGAPQHELHKPARELKGFAKTGLLELGASEKVEIELSADDLASFNDERSAWIADAGRYTVSVGASSRDIRTTATFSVENEIVVRETIAELSPEQGIDEIRP